VQGLEEQQTDPIFVEVCEYYGVRPFFVEEARSTWEEKFLTDMKRRMIEKKPLSDKQYDKLVSVLTGNNSWNDIPATEKQIAYIIRLGYDGETAGLNKGEASELIGNLKRGGLE
jgi:hypothetical protein